MTPTPIPTNPELQQQQQDTLNNMKQATTTPTNPNTTIQPPPLPPAPSEEEEGPPPPFFTSYLLSNLPSLFLPCLTTKEATHLRATNHATLHAVRAFPWQDIITPIRGPPEDWAACFPHARAANIHYRRDLDTHDVKFFFHNVEQFACAGCPQLESQAFTSMTSLTRLDARGVKPLALQFLSRASHPHLVHLTVSKKAHTAHAQRWLEEEIWVAYQEPCRNCDKYALAEWLEPCLTAQACKVHNNTWSDDPDYVIRGLCKNPCHLRKACRRCEKWHCGDCLRYLSAQARQRRLRRQGDPSCRLRGEEQGLREEEKEVVDLCHCELCRYSVCNSVTCSVECFLCRSRWCQECLEDDGVRYLQCQQCYDEDGGLKAHVVVDEEEEGRERDEREMERLAEMGRTALERLEIREASIRLEGHYVCTPCYSTQHEKMCQHCGQGLFVCNVSSAATEMDEELEN